MKSLNPAARPARPSPPRQRGAVLAIGLMMLLVLTLIGVTAMKSTVLDERIAANSMFKMLAFQAAESALSEDATFESVDKFVRKGGVPTPDFIATNNYAFDIGADDRQLSATVTTQISEVGYLPMPGSSLGLGGGAAVQLRVFHIEADIEPESELQNTNAKAKHNMGIGRVVPGPAVP